MKNVSESIRKMVSYLNNDEKDGGYWLPNIQRPFVWSEEQIERLFDSIMREYPISTLLIWKTKSLIRRRKFIDNYKSGLKLTDYYVPECDRQKMLVLDGQQRLQSLFIGLRGSYEGKELYLNILSGDLVAPEDIRYRFKFLTKEAAQFPYLKFKDIVFSNEQPNKLADKIKQNCGKELSAAQAERLMDNVWKIHQMYVTTEAMSYQELDSVDNPEIYTENDVVEIFIRANSGGTKLGKSDLLFSLLTSSWEDAEEQMEDLLSKMNQSGYGYTRDFILKTCLVLLGKGARYDVAKFRDGKTKEAIIEKWDELSAAIMDVRDFVYSHTFIRSDKALPSYLALIPLIYFRYKYPESWNGAKDIDNYILRTLIAGAFSGTPDNLIDKCVNKIDEMKAFSVRDIFGVIREDGRNLDITGHTILEMGYGSKSIHLMFNLWYRDFNYQPSFRDNLPQVDHIFPQSRLKTVKVVNPENGIRNLLKYKQETRDQIANCMLLTADENGAGGKTDIPPSDWFAGKSPEYLERHLIPQNPDLWKLENFELFIEERKKLILNKFAYMLQQKDIGENHEFEAVA
jgi:hypothetical protein